MLYGMTIMPLGAKRAGGDGGSLILPGYGRHPPGSNVMRSEGRFQLNRGFCPLRHHQMRFHLRHFAAPVTTPRLMAHLRLSFPQSIISTSISFVRIRTY